MCRMRERDYMALTDYVIMKGTDYQAICDKLRDETGKTSLLKSGDLVSEIDDIISAQEVYVQMLRDVLSKSITYLEVPEGVTTLPANALYNLVSLKRLKLPSTISNINYYAFTGCSSLEHIEISEGVTNINSYAFYNLRSLKSIQLPSTLRTIANDAFASCTGLQSIIIPEGVTQIGNGLFNGCTSLTSVTLPSTLEIMGNHIFFACSGLSGTVTIPAKVEKIGQCAFERTNLSGVVFENPVGWKYGTSSTNISTSVSETTMGDPTTIASLLRDTYKSYYWARS